MSQVQILQRPKRKEPSLPGRLFSYLEGATGFEPEPRPELARARRMDAPREAKAGWSPEAGCRRAEAKSCSARRQAGCIKAFHSSALRDSQQSKDAPKGDEAGWRERARAVRDSQDRRGVGARPHPAIARPEAKSCSARRQAGCIKAFHSSALRDLQQSMDAPREAKAGWSPEAGCRRAEAKSCSAPAPRRALRHPVAPAVKWAV